MDKRNVLNLIRELKCRVSDTTLDNVKILAKRRQIFTGEEIEVLADIVRDMVENGELIEIVRRNKSTIFDLTIQQEEQSLNVSVDNQNDDFKKEILDVVNCLYQTVEDFNHHFTHELEALKSEKSKSIPSKENRQVSKEKDLLREIAELRKENTKFKEELSRKIKLLSAL